MPAMNVAMPASHVVIVAKGASGRRSRPLAVTAPRLSVLIEVEGVGNRHDVRRVNRWATTSWISAREFARFLAPDAALIDYLVSHG
jgi:hypothetical protein